MARGRRGIKRRTSGERTYPLQQKGVLGAEEVGLPLVHATTVWNAQEIVRQSKLLTQRCKFLGKDLVYFFVLRPAYLGRDGNERNHRISAFPVAFILKPQAVRQPYHLYPFDTGGAIAGAFDDQADRQIPLDDYSLEPSHAAATRFIDWAFGSLAAYFDGRLRHDLGDDVKIPECVAQSYMDIARLGVEGSNVHDKRASTLELTSDHNVDLTDFLDLAIYPKQFIEDNDNFLAKARALGGEIEFYDWRPNRAPNEHQKDLMEISRRWYRQKGLNL